MSLDSSPESKVYSSAIIMYLQCQTSQHTVIYSCRVTSTHSVILTTPLNPVPSLQRAEPSGNIHHTVQAPQKIPRAHLSAVTHHKTFLEKKKKHWPSCSAGWEWTWSSLQGYSSCKENKANGHKELCSCLQPKCVVTGTQQDMFYTTRVELTSNR